MKKGKIDNMKLWTWQNPELDITDPLQKIDSLNKSQYLILDEYSNTQEVNVHKMAYQRLWRKYQSDQIIWCYSSCDAAINYNIQEYKNKILWELNVPSTFILDAICGITWHWIIARQNCDSPDCFNNMFWDIQKLLREEDIAYCRNDFSRDFNSYWSNLSLEDLYDNLSVSMSICNSGCPTIIIKHPIRKEWVMKKTPHCEIVKLK